MEDNIIIENISYKEELYKKALEENVFEDNNIHGIGVDANGDS